jgi:transcriptional regulator with XRE-family HTH domain
MNYNKIEEFRKKLKITQEDIAQKAGISTAGYQQMIYKKNTTVSTLEKISRALGVDPSFWWKEQMVEKFMTIGTEKKMESHENLNERLEQDYIIQFSVIKKLTNYIDLLEKRMKNNEKKNGNEGLEDKEYQNNT